MESRRVIKLQVLESSIIIAAAQGDIKAFKKIFEYYAPRMRPVALLYAQTVLEADDIVSESFMRIYTSLKTYKHEGSFDGWIRRIVVNTALNIRKSRKNLSDLMSPLDNAQESDMGDEVMEYPEDTEPSVLMKIVEALPEGYKIVFSLYVFEELSHKDISQMLGISEGTSRTQYAKAKKSILKMIDRLRNEDKSFLYGKTS